MRKRDKPYSVFEDHQQRVTDLHFLSSDFLVSSSVDNSLKFWAIDPIFNHQPSLRTIPVAHTALSLAIKNKVLAACLANGEIEIIKKEKR